MAWWHEPPFGGVLSGSGAEVSTANATWWLLLATAAAAVATFAAVVVALFTPLRLAEREQLRKSAAAIKLAELACQALGKNPGSDPMERSDNAARKAWLASAESLIHRMDRMPSDYIDDATALADFVWIADLLREGRAIDLMFAADPTVDNGVDRIMIFPNLAKSAQERLAEMRQRLQWRHRFGF